MRTEELPEQFLESMKRMLGTEYQDYISSMKEDTRTALRVNTNKITPEQFMKRDFIIMRMWICRRSIPIIMQDYIIFRSPVL